MTTRSEGSTILLVESDKSEARSRKDKLENFGYNVIIAHSGEEAVKTVSSRHDIDLILMDINHGSYMDHTKAGNTILQNKDVPVLFLVASSETDVFEKTGGIPSYGYIVKDSGMSVFDAGIKSALGLFRTMKELKVEKETLQKSEERLFRAMDASEHGYWDWDIGNDTIYFSPNYYRMLGYEPGDLTGNHENWKNILHPHDEETTLPAIRKCIANGETFSKNIRLKHKDGSWKWISSRGKPCEFNSSGKATRAVGVYVDVDSQVRAEQDNINLTHRVNAGLRIGNLAWWEMHLPSGKVIFDDMKAEMLGYAPERFSTFEDFTSLVHPEDIEKAMQAMRDYLEGNIDVYDVEYRIRTADGTYKFFHDVGGITEKNADTGDIRVIGIVQDVTRRKKAEDSLKNAYNEKKELLSELQHRAKNSFATIESLMRLKSRAVSNPDTKDTIEELRVRVHAIAELYSMLYDTGTPGLVDLGEYCKKITSPMAGLTDKVEFITETENIQSNTRNAATIGLIITEVVTNAIKHAFPEGSHGIIRLELTKHNTESILIISDNGRGIPGGIDHKKTGTMGLMLIGSLAKQLNATMEIDTSSGTSFKFVLPELT